MGDLPDWVQSLQNSGVTTTTQILAVNGTYVADVSNGQSVTIFATYGALSANNLLFKVTWQTNDGTNVITNQQYFGCVGSPGLNGGITVEIPVYGGQITVTNIGPFQFNLDVVVSSRVVTETRVLDDFVGARLFQYSGAFVNGTGVVLPPFDGGDGNYASNGQSWFTASATAAGTLTAAYIGPDGTKRAIAIAAITGAGASSGFVALPQGAVQIGFVPAATAAGQLAFCYLTKAQL